MFVDLDGWKELRGKLVDDVEPPKALEGETPKIRDSYRQRIKQAFSTLRSGLERSNPDVLVIIGDDQDELFGLYCRPGLAIYVSEEAQGSSQVYRTGRLSTGDEIAIECHAGFASLLAEELVKRDFDVSIVHELVPQGGLEKGLGHAFTRIASAMGLEELGIPVILIFLNAYHPPLPSAARCYNLGKAIAEIAQANSERIAIYGSGGLSHDPMGPRAGWIDEPLDLWVLGKIQNSQGHELKNLYTVNSDSMYGGTGEIRSWIAVAGAFEGTSAKVVDYIPSYYAVTGLGFASRS